MKNAFIILTFFCFSVFSQKNATRVKRPEKANQRSKALYKIKVGKKGKVSVESLRKKERQGKSLKGEKLNTKLTGKNGIEPIAKTNRPSTLTLKRVPKANLKRGRDITKTSQRKSRSKKNGHKIYSSPVRRTKKPKREGSILLKKRIAKNAKTTRRINKKSSLYDSEEKIIVSFSGNIFDLKKKIKKEKIDLIYNGKRKEFIAKKSDISKIKSLLKKYSPAVVGRKAFRYSNRRNKSTPRNSAPIESIGNSENIDIFDFQTSYSELGLFGLNPSNEVVQVDYRIQVVHSHVADLEINLYADDDDGNVFYENIWDNYGGTTDLGNDDDFESDQDIYLNWRTTYGFNGLSPNQFWGIEVYDGSSNDRGFIDFIEFDIYHERIPLFADLSIYFEQGSINTFNYDPETFSLEVQNTIINDGNININSEVDVAWYLSKNPNVSIDDTNIGFETIVGLEANTYITTNINVFDLGPEGLDLQEGVYYLSAIVDDEDKIFEINEDNNSMVFDSALGVLWGQNLTIYSDSSVVNEYSYDDQTADLLVTNTILNDGDIDVIDEFGVAWFLSNNNIITTDDTFLDFNLVKKLDVDEFSTQTLKMNLDNIVLDEGDYYIGVFVDDEDVIIEADEFDNSLYFDPPIEYILPPEAGVDIFNISTGNTLITSESGGFASFEIALNTRPDSDVTIYFYSTDQSEAQTTDFVVFTPEDWNDPWKIEVDGVDDGIVDGDQEYSIFMEAESDDQDYDGIFIDDVDGVNVDDETTSTQNPQTKVSMRVFPNPARTFFNIETKNIKIDQHSFFTIVGSDGKIVRKQRLMNSIQVVDISDLSTGTYFVHVWNKQKRILQKRLIKVGY